MRRSAFLAGVGASIRTRRSDCKLTMRGLAEKAKVSERFLVQLEGGHGNISILRLLDVADALDISVAELLKDGERVRAPTMRAAPPGIVALLGLRGAGKSTLGALVARRLKVPFVELDKLIAREAGMKLATIWEMHGEPYFRRIEQSALRKFLDETYVGVVATGGSLIMHSESFDLLRERATTIWLKARPEDHWDRVVAQGDGRPMKDRPEAMNELRGLLKERSPLYALASHVVDTSSVGIEVAVDQIVKAALSRRIKS